MLDSSHLIKASRPRMQYTAGPSFLNALKYEDFEAAPDERVAVTSPSGHGKTTPLLPIARANCPFGVLGRTERV